MSTRLDMVVKQGGKYVVKSHDGKKTLGTYGTEAEANERLRQVEAAKAAKADSGFERVERLDVGQLGAPQKIAGSGFYRLDGYFTRSGVLTYRNPDGTARREYRPADEVFDADSLESLKMMPVTDAHPPALLTAETAADYQRGSVGETVRRDEDKVAGHLIVTDAQLIKKLERGDAVQCSPGYVCDMEPTPGITAKGEKYDAVQRNIRYNHLAIVERGRAGAEVRLRMDAESLAVVLDQHPQVSGEHTVPNIRIDGIDYPSDSPALVQAFAQLEKRHADAIAAADKRASDAAKSLETVQAKLDAGDGEIKKLKADAAELPKKVRAEIAARVALENRAREVLGSKVKLDALDDKAVRLLVLEKLAPSAKFDGKSDAYLEARFDSEIERFDAGDKESDTDDDEDDKKMPFGKKAKKDADDEEREDGELDEHGRVKLDADEEREKMMKHNRKMASRPVGARLDDDGQLRVGR